MVFFRLQRKLIRIKSFRIAKPVLFARTYGKIWLVEIFF